MSNNPLVSVIVPVYNVEKYIYKCVLSLINQEYKNIEIILVNDGSLDQSVQIIDELVRQDCRVRVIHKSNGGVSSARNMGIEHSKGTYIMFVDGDDWVEPTYVSYFLKLIEKCPCEIGMNKNYFPDFSKTLTPDSDNKYIITSDKAAEYIYNGDIFVAVWNKIYSKKFINDNNIRFHEDIWFGEGMLFNIECLQYMATVAVGEKRVYHQTPNPSSAMREFNLKSNLCGIKSMEKQKEICDKFSSNVQNAWKLHRYCYHRNIIDGLVKTKSIGLHRKIYKDCIKQLRINIFVPLTLEKKIKSKIIWILYFIFPRFISNFRNKRQRRLM